MRDGRVVDAAGVAKTALLVSALSLALSATAFGQTPAKKTVNLAVWAQFVEADGPQPNLEELLKEIAHG